MASPDARSASGGRRIDGSPARTHTLLLLSLVFLVLAAPRAGATLDLHASLNPQPARPGEMLQLELTVTNTDAFARTGVVVSLIYPAGLLSAAPGNFGASCPPSFCDPGETVTWTLGTLGAGRSLTVDMPPVIAAATAPGTVISFNATATDGVGGLAAASVATTVDNATVYDLALRDHADPIASGSNLRYRIAFGYREEAAGVAASTLRFFVPAGTSFVSADGGGSHSAGTVEWHLGTLLPGEGGTREVTVAVQAPSPGVLTASASVFASATPALQATAQSLTVVDTAARLALALDANADPARPGEHLNVQMVVTNRDAVTRTGLSLRVRYPDGITSFALANINGAACTPSFCDPTDQVTYAIPSLAAGQSLTLELPAIVAATTPDGTLVNFYALLSDASGGNASAIDSVRVRTSPRYDLALRDNLDPVEPLGALTYRLYYGYREEAGAVAASTLRLRLAPGTSFISATDNGLFAGGEVSWDLGTLAPGESGYREAVVQVNAPHGAVLQPYAEVFATATPIEQASAEGLTIVHNAAALSVQLDVNADPVLPREHLNLQATVTNHDAVARSPTLRLRYPGGDGAASIAVSNTTASCPPSFCDPGEIVTWNLGSIGPGQARTVDLPPAVANAAPGGLLVNFYAIVNDPAGGNASAIDTVRVRTSPRFDLALRESADPVEPGALLRYKLSFGYRMEAPTIADGMLQFRLPTGTSFVSASAGGHASGDVVSWDLGSIDPGRGGFREVVVAVEAADASVLQASAWIFDNDDPDANAAAEARTTVAMGHPLAVQVDVNADAARAELLNVQYVVTNRDVVTRNVTLRGRYPQDVLSFANAHLGWSPAGACPPSFCDPGEYVTYAVGDLAAGQSVTVELASFVNSASADGVLLNFFAIATDTGGGVATSTDAARVDLASRYDLTVRDSADPVVPGGTLEYRLIYGYRADAPVVANSRLRFRLPAGTSFVSASGNATVAGEFVTWNLGSMQPGDGGVRTVVVDVDAGDASVLQAQAEIFDISRAYRQAMAEALTAVESNPPIALQVRADSNLAQPNAFVDVRMTVTNLDSIARTTTLRLRYPDGLFSLSPVSFIPIGSCPPSFCDPGEMVTWNLGVLQPGQSVTVIAPPRVLNTAVNGQLVNFFAIATDTLGGIATGIDTVRLGVCADDDSDCDGVLDASDNCLYADNADQRDVDGDGIGSVCDADLNQTCTVNFADLSILRAAFFSSNALADLDGNGQVNFADLSLMRQLFFRPPGPSGVPNLCSAAGQAHAVTTR